MKNQQSRKTWKFLIVCIVCLAIGSGKTYERPELGLAVLPFPSPGWTLPELANLRPDFKTWIRSHLARSNTAVGLVPTFSESMREYRQELLLVSVSTLPRSRFGVERGMRPSNSATPFYIFHSAVYSPALEIRPHVIPCLLGFFFFCRSGLKSF